MYEGDAEDLWLSCLGHAMEMHGCVDGRRPRNLNLLVVRRLADALYDQCLAKTAEQTVEQKKKAPVLQLRT